MLHDAIKTILNGVLPYFIKKDIILLLWKKTAKPGFPFKQVGCFFLLKKQVFLNPDKERFSFGSKCQQCQQRFFFWTSSSNHCLAVQTRRRCWAVIWLFNCPELSGHAVHEDVDGLDIGGQHLQQFVFLWNTHRLQRRLCAICTSRSGNVQHWCGGSWGIPGCS